MPKSTEAFLRACREYSAKWGNAIGAAGAPATDVRVSVEK
jgi:hypothetical protein